MNKEKLRQVREAIIKHKQRFEYKQYITNEEGTAGELLLDDDECGTCGCVAGWTCALFAPDTPTREIEDMACEILEIGELGGPDENVPGFLFLCGAGFGFPDKEYWDMHYIDAVERMDFLLEREEA